MRRVGLLLALLATAPSAQVLSQHELDATDPVLAPLLDPGDGFASSVACVGDLDGDGSTELAVGARGDGDGALLSGAVHVLFLKADGSVEHAAKISNLAGGLGSVLGFGEAFGSALAPLGDLDGDGVADLAVGSTGTIDPDTGFRKGGVRILFLNADASVKGSVLIREDEGGFGGVLGSATTRFGTSLANLGDLDGDGVVDLAVGDIGGSSASVWILFLNADGTVKGQVRHLGSLLASFGSALASVGDLNGDGRRDLAVGLYNQPGSLINTGGAGEVRILFLESDGSILGTAAIGQGLGGFPGPLVRDDHFGSALACLGDVDGDGNQDLAVGAVGVDDTGVNEGVVWGLLLNTDGSVKASWRIAEGEGGFRAGLQRADAFGSSLALMEDRNADGFPELVVGALGDDGAGGYPSALDYGAAWLLFGSEQGQALVERRDAPGNPPTYSLGPVLVGGTFDATVDVAASEHDFALVFGFDTAVSIPLGSGPVLLCFDVGGQGELLGLPTARFGPLARFTFPVPNDGSLGGSRVASQALVWGFARPFALTNAQDLTVGTF